MGENTAHFYLAFKTSFAKKKIIRKGVSVSRKTVNTFKEKYIYTKMLWK